VLSVAAHQRSSVLALTSFPRQLATFAAPLLGAALAPLGPTGLFTAASVAFAAAWAMMRWTTARPASVMDPTSAAGADADTAT